jgi:hypothetical protein
MYRHLSLRPRQPRTSSAHSISSVPMTRTNSNTGAEELPFHIRFGLAFFSSIAVIASVTAGAAALYVFWIVSQDFSA